MKVIFPTILVTLVGAVRIIPIFLPPSMLVFAGWHHKIKAKVPTLGGKEHNVLPQYSLRSKRFRLVSEQRKTEHGL